MSYPLALYNFRVTVGAQLMSFSEVSGIAFANDHVVYRHGLSFWEGEDIATFHLDAFAPITLKRGTIVGPDVTYLYDWLKKRAIRRVDVSLCDERGDPVMAWQIQKAIATKLSAPTFDANTNEVAIESLELQARGVSFVKL